ncbi:MAG: hypothetical protein SV201_11705 [Pseudomonadota bacterium]|nr:hypothetical protein [Pseudomonadota bacterium]
MAINKRSETLQIKLDVDGDGQVRASLAGVGQNIDRVDDGQVRATRNAKLLRGALAALPVAILGHLAQRALDSADALAKSADAADISTTALQELRFAAEQSGVEINQLDDGVRRFTRRLGLAADGTGPAVQAFEALNVGVLDANGQLRNTEVILDETIAKLAAMDNQARRSALASQLFGDDAGPKLSLLLAQGTDSIEEMRKQAHELGLVLDEDAVRAAERAGDQIDILKQKIGTQFTATVIDNAEAIEDMTDALIRLVDWLGTATTEVVEFSKWLGEELAATIHGISGDDLVRLELKLKDINDQINTVNDTGLNFFGLGSNEETIKELEKERQLIIERIELARKLQASRTSGGPDPGTGDTGAPTGGGVSPTDDDAAEKEQERYERELQALRRKLEDEATLEVEAWWEKQALLDEARAQKDISEAEHRQYTEELEAQHLERLGEIRLEAANKETEIERKKNAAIEQSRRSFMNNMTSLMSSESETMFKIGKAAALGQAAYKGSLAVMDAWEAGMSVGGPWAPAVAAAYATAAAANAVTKIQAIKNTKFGGGGGVSVSGSGGVTTGANFNGGAPITSQPSSVNQIEESRQQTIFVELPDDDDRQLSVRQWRNMHRELQEANPDARLVY